MIFDKIGRASREFLKISDTSLVNKLFLFETESVCNFYRQVSSFFIFPIYLFITVSAMINVKDYTTGLTFLIFLVACMSLSKIVKTISLNLQRTAFYVSKRSSTVFYFLKYFREIKMAGLENYTEKEIYKLRKYENDSMDMVDSKRSIANFVFALAPIISIGLILIIQTKL